MPIVGHWENWIERLSTPPNWKLSWLQAHGDIRKHEVSLLIRTIKRTEESQQHSFPSNPRKSHNKRRSGVVPETKCYCTHSSGEVQPELDRHLPWTQQANHLRVRFCLELPWALVFTSFFRLVFLRSQHHAYLNCYVCFYFLNGYYLLQEGAFGFAVVAHT